MKKLFYFFGVVLIIILGACSSTANNKKELNDIKDIYVYESEVKPNYLELEDGFIRVNFDWEFGKNEDTLIKKTFMESNISINAYQGSQMLILDAENSSGLGNKIYEKSKGNVSLAYKLINNTTPVDFKVFYAELESKNQPVKFSVDISELSPPK